jgi:predicted nucleic acid-binding protein
MSPESALRYIDHLGAWPVTVTDFKSVCRAIELSIGSMLSFWDAVMVIAAEGSGARIIYSEDLRAGQELPGVRIVNPFQALRSERTLGEEPP